MSFTNGELRTCKTCGNVFLYNKFGKAICPNCLAKEDQDFDAVKDYILEHPSSTIQVVSTATKVRINRIREFLREGRLVIPDSSPIFLNCEICSAPIKYGRICRSCAASLDPEVKVAMKINEFTIGDKPETTKGGTVRFLS